MERAQIVLAVANGEGTSGTAREVGVSRPMVIKGRDRFAQLGLAGLEDDPRPGRAKTVDDSAIIATTLEPPPDSLAVTHWSRRGAGLTDVQWALLEPLLPPGSRIGRPRQWPVRGLVAQPQQASHTDHEAGRSIEPCSAALWTPQLGTGPIDRPAVDTACCPVANRSA